MLVKYNPLDEVVSAIHSLLEVYGNPKILLLGSYAKGENKHIKRLDGTVISLSDLEFLIFSREDNKLARELDSIERLYRRKLGSYFKIDYDFVFPSLRILILRNRLLFYEGYKSANIKDWRMELVMFKPFNIIESNQTMIWRTFALRKILKETQNELVVSYFCARNILDLFLVFVYNHTQQCTSHRLREDYLKENKEKISQFISVSILEKSFACFHDLNTEIRYEDYVRVFQGLSKFKKSRKFRVLPPLRDRIMRKAFGQLELLRSYQITEGEFLRDLLDVVESPVDSRHDNRFIGKYHQLFPYLKNYEKEDTSYTS